jgi:hypothetical protein
MCKLCVKDIVLENFIRIEPLLRGHLSYKVTFSLSQRWLVNTDLTVFMNKIQNKINHTVGTIPSPTTFFPQAVVKE